MKLEKWIKPYINALNGQKNWRDSLVAQTQKTGKYYVGMSVYEEIPEPIKTEILGFSSEYMEYHLKIGACNIFVKIHYPTFQPLLSTYEKIIEKMATWLNIAIRVKPPMCGKELSVHLFMSTHKKMYSADTALDRIHVNTAYTTGCVEKASICIFREEEWFKVFIHETFHSFGMSFNESHEQFLNREFYGHVAGRHQQDLRLYEVHCELMATIFNCALKSYWEKTSFMKNVKREQAFSLYQCHKVLRTGAYGNNSSAVTDFDDVVPREEEKTSVFSYYIAKTILLLSIDDFVGFLYQHSTNFVVYEWNEEKVAKYIGHIFGGFAKFKKVYNSRLPFKKHGWQKTCEKTMRMTIGGKKKKRKTMRMS